MGSGAREENEKGGGNKMLCRERLIFCRGRGEGESGGFAFWSGNIYGDYARSAWPRRRASRARTSVTYCSPSSSGTRCSRSLSVGSLIQPSIGIALSVVRWAVKVSLSVPSLFFFFFLCWRRRVGCGLGERKRGKEGADWSTPSNTQTHSLTHLRGKYNSSDCCPES